MTDTRFDLILTGNVVPGVSRDVAINKLAALFKRPVEQVDKLLAGKSSRIRKDLDQTELQRYQQAFSRIGVITEVVPSAAERQADNPTAAVAKESTLLSTLSLCPNGTPVLSDHERHHPPIYVPDAEHFSIAATGEMLTQNEAIPLPAPDTDHISLAPTGATIMPPSESNATAAAQASHLTLCGAGTPLLDQKPKTTYRVPNTEHLSLK